MSKRVFSGIVVSCKVDKMIVVKVEKYAKHTKYKKSIKLYKKYVAHDEDNKYKVGDVVNIVESIPISKIKKWAVVGN